MNSVRARPTPAFGIAASANALARIADDQHHLRSRLRAPAPRRRGRPRRERLRRTRVPPRPRRSTRSLRRRRAASLCRVPVPTMHGKPEFARDDRRMSGPSALVGDDRGDAPHHRLPIGIGHLGDEHLARLHRAQAPSTSRTTRTRPTPIFSPTACPVTSGGPASPSAGYTSAAAVRGFRGMHRLRPRLDDDQVSRRCRPSPIRCPSAAGGRRGRNSAPR